MRRGSRGQRWIDESGSNAGSEPGAPPEGTLRGIVIRAYGKYFDAQIQGDDRVLLCTVRGAVRRFRRGTDLVAVGDYVWVRPTDDGEGQIEFVEPRVRSLARLARNTNDVEQVILANPDQALFVFAWKEPEPHTRMLDRFLVLAESRGLPSIIGMNKVDLDLVGHPGIDAFIADYLPIYPVLTFSATEGIELEAVRQVMEGKVTVVAGPSGVGKSSLLNALHPEGDRQIGEISDATGKGRHTTTSTVLYEIAPGTYVADTPGIRALALQGVDPEELPDCFPEFRPYLGSCFYADCTHIHEPGCAVLAARDRGDISQNRWDSYHSLRSGMQE